MSIQLVGGFADIEQAVDQATTESIREIITCGICLMILDDPQECATCQSQFCNSCIQYWQKTRSRGCPIRCRGSSFRPSHKMVKTLLNELKVHCSNKESGCDFQTRYPLLKEHLNNCDYELVHCQGHDMNSCQTKGIRKQVKEHEKVCPLFPVNCEHCHTSVARQELDNHRTHFCHRVPKQCSFCEMNVPSIEHRDHEKLCAIQEIECKFCSQKLQRKDLKDHYELQCDKYPVNCEAYPACKLTIARCDQQEHANVCPQIKEVCHGLCGDLVRRKHMTQQADGSYEHDCIRYLKRKAMMQKHKAQYLKEAAIYQSDVHKVYCEEDKCKTCLNDKNLLNLPINDTEHYKNTVKNSIANALHNLANLSIQSGFVGSSKSDLLEKAQSIVIRERLMANTSSLLNICNHFGIQNKLTLQQDKNIARDGQQFADLVAIAEGKKMENQDLTQEDSHQANNSRPYIYEQEEDEYIDSGNLFGSDEY